MTDKYHKISKATEQRQTFPFYCMNKTVLHDTLLTEPSENFRVELGSLCILTFLDANKQTNKQAAKTFNKLVKYCHYFDLCNKQHLTNSDKALNQHGHKENAAILQYNPESPEKVLPMNQTTEVSLKLQQNISHKCVLFLGAT